MWRALIILGARKYSFSLSQQFEIFFTALRIQNFAGIRVVQSVSIPQNEVGDEWVGRWRMDG